MKPTTKIDLCMLGALAAAKAVDFWPSVIDVSVALALLCTAIAARVWWCNQEDGRR